MKALEGWKQRVRTLKTETYALSWAYRDPRVPWYAKALLALVVAHTLSPIDLIPDFIPILGYLDDLVIVPLGITLARRMVPEAVMVESRAKARAALDDARPTSWIAAAVILAIWVLVATLGVVLIVRAFNG